MNITTSMLDRRITLQMPFESIDAQGSVIQEWRDSAEIWAGVKDLEGAEAVEGTARRAIQAREFTVRYQRAIAGTGPTYRIKYANEFFDIVSVNPLPLGRPGFLVFSTVRNADGSVISADAFYFLNGNGGRFSNNEGGFFLKN